MNREIAHHTVFEVFCTGKKLTHIIELMRDHCDKEEARALGLKIAAVFAEMCTIVNYIVKQHPDIEIEMDYKIKKYESLVR